MIGEFFIIKKKVLKDISRIFNNKNDRILDLGSGEYPDYHKSIKGKLICLDKNKTKTAHIVADADAMPLKANSFDKVISINSIYYFKNPFNVVEDVHKILKKNGKFVLMAPFFYPIHDVPFDKYRFTEHGLVALLEDHFKIDEVKTFGGIFNIPAIMIHSIIKGMPLLFPKPIRKLIGVLAYVFYPFYIMAQAISLFDVIDRTKRFPTYYFIVASKK